jgi:hypothetical protein
MPYSNSVNPVTVLALALAYMAFADRVSQPTVKREQQLQQMQEDPAGYGD